MTRTVIILLTFAISAILLLTLSFSFKSASKKNLQKTYVCTPCNSDCDNIIHDKGGMCSHCNMPLIPKEDQKTKTIAFYLQDGVEVLDFAGPMEVFAYAGYEVFTVSKSKEPIISQGIVKIVPDYDITNTPSADILAFFGGNASEAYKDSRVIEWVKAQTGIEYYFSVCTGAFILAESGLLKDKTATTFHNALDDFEKRYPETKVLKDTRFVDNGRIITTAGISAGIDGALHLVAKLDGFNTARKIAYHMEYDKWVPGEGLLLSDENPYANFTKISELKKYEGVYEYLDDLQVKIKIDANEKSLFAIVEGRKYPLYYHSNDNFSNVSGDTIIFQRTENNAIVGFMSSKYGNRIFGKLK